MLDVLLNFFRPRKTITLMWARQGTKNWQDWWLRQYGPVTSHTPNESEHLSFLNHDLKLNGLPIAIEYKGGYVIPNVKQGDIPPILHHIKYHGFEVVSID